MLVYDKEKEIKTIEVAVVSRISVKYISNCKYGDATRCKMKLF